MHKINFYLLLLIYISTIFIRNTKADYITLILADKCKTIIEMRIEEKSVLVNFEIGEKDISNLNRAL